LCLSVCCFSTPPPAEHHTPSLHDALPISPGAGKRAQISATTVDSPSRGRKLRRVLERAKRSPARRNHSFVACLPLVLRVFCAAPDGGPRVALGEGSAAAATNASECPTRSPGAGKRAQISATTVDSPNPGSELCRGHAR